MKRTWQRVRFTSSRPNPVKLDKTCKRPFWEVGHRTDKETGATEYVVVGFIHDGESIKGYYPDVKEIEILDCNLPKPYYSKRFPKPFYM